MPTDQTQDVMDRYFALMSSGADFSECYTADATWLVADTGELISGAGAVKDYVIALHAAMDDMKTHTYVVGSDHVYLEGDCASMRTGLEDRIRYCVAYDIVDGRIGAMRCYGADGLVEV
jgi:ketosteroid isomerase-like protein